MLFIGSKKYFKSKYIQICMSKVEVNQFYKNEISELEKAQSSIVRNPRCPGQYALTYCLWFSEDSGWVDSQLIFSASRNGEYRIGHREVTLGIRSIEFAFEEGDQYQYILLDDIEKLQLRRHGKELVIKSENFTYKWHFRFFGGQERLGFAWMALLREKMYEDKQIQNKTLRNQLQKARRKMDALMSELQYTGYQFDILAKEVESMEDQQDVAAFKEKLKTMIKRIKKDAATLAIPKQQKIKRWKEVYETPRNSFKSYKERRRIFHENEDDQSSKEIDLEHFQRQKTYTSRTKWNVKKPDKTPIQKWNLPYQESQSSSNTSDEKPKKQIVRPASRKKKPDDVSAQEQNYDSDYERFRQATKERFGDLPELLNIPYQVFRISSDISEENQGEIESEREDEMPEHPDSA